MNLNLYLVTHSKINSKWTTDLYVNDETTKILKETGKNFHSLQIGKKCLGTEKAHHKRKTIDKLDSIKIYNLHVSKATIKKISYTGRKY